VLSDADLLQLPLDELTALARAVRDGRRREFEAFGWKPEDVPDPNARETFERSKLNWAELDDPRHRAVYDWHRSLIALRRGLPVCTSPVGEDVRVHLDGSGVLRFDRSGVSVTVDIPRGWSVDVADSRD